LFRLKNESSNEIQNLSQSLSTVPKPAEEHTIKDQQKRVVPSQRSFTIENPRSQHRVNNKAERHGTSTSLRHSETSIQPSLSRKSGLTRTTRKSYFEQKKSPFAFFGWNESDRNIGQKKTYNVHAPESEVCLMRIHFVAIQHRLPEGFYTPRKNPHTSFHCAEGTLMLLTNTCFRFDVNNNLWQSYQFTLGFSYHASSMLYNKSYQLMRLL